MDGKDEDRRAEQVMFESAGFRSGSEDMRPPGGRPGPAWRAWLLSIVAAVILSAAATLLLGGSFHLPGGSNAAGGCGAGSGGPCCPPQGGQGK